MSYRLPLLLIMLFTFSCKQSSSHIENRERVIADVVTIEPSAKDSFEIGKVISHVTCNNNSAQSFALYLPKNYSASSEYPVIYFFDSHASGRFPLDKYAALADEFNFILVGSNDSKNGMLPDALMNIANNLMNDMKQRLPIKFSRQYLAGFSGGARVAGMVAMQTPGIAGVIACSAGINTNNQNNLSFCFVAIAGKEDFNMDEVVALNKQLDHSSTTHQLLLFDGKHEWCPTSTMKDAFLFLETAAMRNKTTTVNTSLLNNFISKEEKQAKKFQATNKLLFAADNYEKLIHYTEDLQDTKKYKLSLQSIQQNNSYKKEKQEAEQLAAQENQLRDHYMHSLGKEITWWENEVGKINEEVKRQGKSESAFMLKRMLGAMSLTCYMQATAYMNADNLVKADYFLQVYCMVDPTNSEAWYLSAELHAKQTKIELCLQELAKAINNGFKERERMMNDPAFSSIVNTTSFISLLNKIQT